MSYNPKTEVEQAARQVSDYINHHTWGEGPKALAKELANDHPTLQQGIMRVCLAFIREMAAKQYVDARNEGSHEVAKRIVAMLDAEPERLPFI